MGTDLVMLFQYLGNFKKLEETWEPTPILVAHSSASFWGMLEGMWETSKPSKPHTNPNFTSRRLYLIPFVVCN